MGVISNRSGVRDWLIQRVSALIMLLYAAVLTVIIAVHSPLSYSVWCEIFGWSWMKVFSIIFMLSLCYHVWVGVWTVLTDYVHCYCGRSLLNVVVLLSLIWYFIWFIQIVWGV